jgi:DNA-binding beta-propeller fold protein YncE
MYPINLGTGCLGVATVFPLAPGGVGPVSIGITPFNGCLFTSDNVSGTIDAFTINPVNGFLAPAAGSPIAAGPNPAGLAVDHAGGPYVYVANNVAAGTITGFQFTPGTCTPLIPAPITPTGANPVGVAIDPAGQFLAVTNSGVNTLTTYPIIPGAGGALGPANPVAATKANPQGVALTSFGQMAFVANNGVNSVSSYLLTVPGGAPVVNGGANATGVKPMGVTMDWTGTYFYVADSGAGTVHGYKPNVTTGKPGAAFGFWAAGIGPTAIAIQP